MQKRGAGLRTRWGFVWLQAASGKWEIAACVISSAAGGVVYKACPFFCGKIQRCELEWFMKADMLHMHLWLQKIIYLSSIANSRENPTNSGSSTISTVKNLLGW